MEQATALESVGDLLAHRAREALKRIIDRDATHITFGKMDREDWRDYGEQLYAKRAVTASNTEYCQWIKDEKLDRGPAAHQPTRSEAIWLYQNWTVIQQLYNGNQNHPIAIRTECRKLGFEWAGKTEHQKTREAGSRRNQYSWTRVVLEEGLLPPKSSRNTRRVKRKIAERWPDINVKDPAHEDQLRIACRTLVSERKQQRPQPPPPPTKPELLDTSNSEPQAAAAPDPVRSALASAGIIVPERFSKADLLQQFIALRANFHEAVRGEVTRQLPDEARREIERAREAADTAHELERIWRHRATCAVKALQLFADNWRSLIGCLHPDRATRSPESLAKASDIVTRTRSLIEETDYKKWVGKDIAI